MWVFRRAKHIFGDHIGAPRHVDAQESISSQIIVYRRADHVFENYFGESGHVRAHETISSPFIV